VRAELVDSPGNALEVRDDEIVATTTAMASTITLRVGRPRAGSPAALRAATNDALDVFHDTHATASRFDPTSPLSRANADPERWHAVPRTLYRALVEAHVAHKRTAGRFDPRVIDTLVELGYGTSLDFAAGGVVTPAAPAPARAARPAWRLRARARESTVHLGGCAVDLGGIAKGLSVRWARQRLSRVTADYLVEAGGDCYCAGTSPEGDRWRVAVEDPRGGPEPVAVLSLSDRAVATSSIRLRHWRAGGAPVHHLIDPATSRPGGDGLLAVTVVGRDPAWAEVWSKVLFLEGERDIAAAARRRGVAALWVRTDGSLATSEALGDALCWVSA
jgi:FAD:protein FMN transferase